MPLAGLLRRAADPAGDADLLGRYATARDEAAFAELVRRHGPLVRGVCRRMLGTTDADDAAQAVFLSLARQAGRVRHADPLSGWLHAVSVRVCRKAWRRRAKPTAVARPAVADPADEASWREVAAVVDDILARLPDRLRQPLVLCYLDSLTRDEAAAKLGWPADTFRGRLDRGRARLRADLTRRGFGLPAGLLVALLSAPRGDAAIWAAGAVRTILDPAGPPAAVAALSVGVGWTMRTKLMLGAVTLVMAGGLAVSGRPAADPPPKVEPVKPVVAKPADPPVAGPVRAARPKLTGTWTATDAPLSSAGRRVVTVRVLDDKRLVWTEQVTGVREYTTSREWGYTVFDLGAGDELLQIERPGQPTDPAQRPEQQQYPMTWGRAATGPVLYLASGGSRASGSRIRLVPAADQADAGPDVRPVPPKKEPAYQGKPRYLYLAFGPTGDTRVWAVADGNRLYLDRNGDGDLTNDPDSPVTALPAGQVPTPPQSSFGPPGGGGRGGGPGSDSGAREAVLTRRGHTFAAGKLAVGGGRYADFLVYVASLGTDGSDAAVRVNIGGKWDEVGTATTPPGDTPAAAPVVWFDRGTWVLRPVAGSTAPLVGQPAEVRAEFTYPSPPGRPFGHVVRSTDDIPADKCPLVRTEAFGRSLDAKLAERQTTAFGVWGVFAGNAMIREMPDRNPIQVTLAFPDCPLGKIEPFTYELWYRQPLTPPVQTVPAARGR